MKMWHKYHISYGDHLRTVENWLSLCLGMERKYMDRQRYPELKSPAFKGFQTYTNPPEKNSKKLLTRCFTCATIVKHSCFYCGCNTHTGDSGSRAYTVCCSGSNLWRITTESEVKERNYDCCLHEENARERCTFRTPDSQMEPEVPSVHLHQQEQHLHY